MLPLNAFENFIAEHRLFERPQKILLAVSGGKDSVVMTRLFKAAGLLFGVAHCNFNLRGEESDEDQLFVAGLAKELNVDFHVKAFDTTKFALEGKISIQMAARELRYRWFEEVRRQSGYDYVALAHHQNDFVETILLNLVRGTGIAGLHGILPKRHQFVRPLLFLSRAEIDQIVDEENFAYREDSSNLSAKYARNKIRLEVIPRLKEINPALEDTFHANSRRFSELEELLHLKLEELKAGMFEEMADGSYRIDLEKLKRLRPLKLLLYELFKPFSFSESVLADLVEAWDGQPGKTFASASHKIILDRNVLLLVPEGGDGSVEVNISHDHSSCSWKNFRFSIFNTLADQLKIEKGSGKAYVDAELLKFPLRIRSWKNGDYFYPLGLKGKKKLSDYYTNLKIPLPAKNNIPLLVNGNGDIIWIGGYRMDDRYKVSEETKKVTIFEITS